MVSKEEMKKDVLDNDTWIGDTGASCHMTNDDAELFDVKTTSDSVTVGNKSKLVATKIGKLRATIVHKDGTTVDLVLNKVKFIPELGYKLFSITDALKKCFKSRK